VFHIIFVCKEHFLFKLKLICHINQIYHGPRNMLYRKYKHMLDSELESYLSYLYLQKKLSLKQISDDLGCSQATVSRLCKKYKIPVGINHNSRIPYEKYGFGSLKHLLITISACLKTGLNKKQIATNIGCSRRTIIRICNKYELDSVSKT